MSSELFDLAHETAEQTLNYPYKIWGFGEGIALDALWQAAEVLNEPRYRQFVLDCFEQWLERGIEERDHSAPGDLLLKAYQFSGDARYLERAKQLAEHMRGLPVNVEGTRFHRPHHPDYHHYLYVDCMEVDAPFLCHLAHVTDTPAYFDEAVQQLLGYSHLLRDPHSGLFYHQFDGETGAINGAFWGRGNGWAILGMLKTLECLPEDHSAYSVVKRAFQALAEDLVRTQHDSGEWSTVLDQAQTYREASLSAMFGYALQKGIELRLLPDHYQMVAERAWSAMRGHLEHGILRRVSLATPPGDAPHYDRISVTDDGVPWGQGPALLLILSHLR